jgi:hypothetical protein
MALIRLYMTMSLDGYITGPQDSVDAPMGDHHDGVPVFVLTHHVPDDPPPGSVRYVTDVRGCASQARAAARGRRRDGARGRGGAGAAARRAARRAGTARRTGPARAGRRLLDNLPAEHIELDLVRRLTTPEVEELAQHVVHLRYRVRRR